MATITDIWRYPIKSMAGESVEASPVTPRGVLGDRGYALLDAETGKVASAKNPRKWPHLLDYAAEYVTEPSVAATLPPARITLPSGTELLTDDPEVDALLSRALQRTVTLSSAAPAEPELEEYWPDLTELDHQDAVTDEAMPSGTFFDLASVHLVTTATLARLAKLYPDGDFALRRFRPNLVVDTGAEIGFIENNWIGHTVAIGAELRLRITGGCPRCVMTTLEQPGLPKDTGILRTAARQNDTQVGVYGEVVQPGTVHRQDAITLD